MRLLSEFSEVFRTATLNTAERLNTVEASFSIKFQTLPSAEVICSLCRSVPVRDSLKLILKNDSEDIVCITNQQVHMPDFSTLIYGLSPEDNIDIKLQIDKSVSDGKFSIYDFDSFSEDLVYRPGLEVLRWFSGLLHGERMLKFEVFDYDISFSTRTMAFESSENAIFSSKIDRNQRLRACKDTAYFYNMDTLEVIPDDFIIEGVMRAGDCLRPLFGKLATLLSLVYVATSASINNKSVSIQISGQRMVSYELPMDNIHENEKWQSIYTWIYTDGNPTDKALISHNIISLHCKFVELLDLDSAVFEAIKTNYNLYLRNNVQQYLDMKRDIAKFIQNVVAQVGDYAIAILEKFKANLIAIFGFLFTVVLTKIGGTQKWNEIFTRHTVYLIEIFVWGSLVYMFLCLFEISYKLKKTKQGYIQLKKNYQDVLTEAEIKEAFSDDKLLHDTERTVKNGIIGWSIVWGLSLIVTIVIVEVFTTNKGLIVWLWNKIFDKV